MISLDNIESLRWDHVPLSYVFVEMDGYVNWIRQEEGGKMDWASNSI